MAFVGLRVPHDAARLLEELDVPGERLSASDMHVTILYLGKDVPVVELAKAFVAAYGVARSTRPLAVTLSSASSFPAGKDGVPVICLIDSPELQKLHSDLKAEFTRLGLPFSDKFPDYRPHVTLSYVKDQVPDGYAVDAPFPGPLVFSSHELTIWGGDDGDGRVMVSLPFVLSPVERMASRIVGRQ